MRLSDICPSFLLELTMNHRAFADITSKNNDALVGFEFEVFVPQTSDLYSNEQQDTPQTTQLSDITDLDTLTNLFYVDRTRLRQIHDYYDEWAEEQAEDYASRRWRSFLDDKYNYDDDDVEDATDNAREHFIKNEADINDFIANVGAAKIADYFDLEPKHGWEDGKVSYHKNSSVYNQPQFSDRDKDDIDVEATQQTLAKSLQSVVGDPVAVDGRTSSDGNTISRYSTWNIVSDASISNDTKGVGAEIISPPLPVDKAIDMMNRVFAWIDKHDIKTNKTTGLHVNVSVPDIANKLDPVKLALLLGDHHVLNQFNRLGNTYAESQLSKLVDYAAHHGRSKVDDALAAQLRTAFSNKKYVSFNLSKLRDGYIEFRSPGGVDYHKGSDALQAVKRFVSAVIVSCDPDAYRQQYLKKLAQLLNVESSTYRKYATKARHPSQQLPDTIQRFSKIDDDVEQYFKVVSQTNSPKMALTYYVNMLERINDIIERHNITLSFNDKRFLRGLIKQHQLNVNDIVTKLQQLYEEPFQADPILLALGLIKQKTPINM